MWLLPILMLFLLVPDRIDGHGDVSGFDKAILETWQNSALHLCSNPGSHFAADALFSYRIRIGFDHLNVEVRNLRPILIRLVNFIPENVVQKLQNFHDQMEKEELQVFGSQGSFTSRGRRAAGFWIEKDDGNVTEIFQKFKRSFFIDPQTAESFLMLSYDKNGHYAPHFDYMDMNEENGDYWFKNFGNRLATALFIIKTADDGGGTVFPSLGVVVTPSPGDVILWFNSKTTSEREDLSLHGACPIVAGRKIAISLWIRSRPQDSLYCRDDDDHTYRIADIFKSN